jgi:hypothetical protein
LEIMIAKTFFFKITSIKIYFIEMFNCFEFD